MNLELKRDCNVNSYNCMPEGAIKCNSLTFNCQRPKLLYEHFEKLLALKNALVLLQKPKVKMIIKYIFLFFSFIL